MAAPGFQGLYGRIQIPRLSARAWDWGEGVGELMMLAMIVKLVHAIALVTLSLAVFCNAQRVIPVAVGREGNELKLRFSPEEIFASVGDMIQFQFYPVNHSAVQADFYAPCVPIKNRTGQGFFSGFRPLPLNTEIITTFTINVTRSDPIFFYCSQGRHCQQGFVGVINPTVEKTLAAFRAAAERAPETLSPGETSTLTTPEPQPNIPYHSFQPSFTNEDNDRTITNVGAIVGSVLGGVALFVILVTFIVFLVMRKKGMARDAKAKSKRKVALRHNSSYGAVNV